MPNPFVNNPATTASGNVTGDSVASDFALDFFGVDPGIVTGAIDPNAFRSQVPRTRTRTSHGLLIRVAGGRVVGAVQGFTHNQQREVRDVFEIDAGAHGYGPVDMEPANTTTRTLSIERFDLWQRPCEEAFGTGFEYVNLADQARPFTLRTAWQSPVGGLFGGRRVYEYTGCYFTRFGRTARSTDTRIVNVNAEIAYVLRRRVS